MAGQGALLVPSSLPCLCSTYCVQRGQAKPIKRAWPPAAPFGGRFRVGAGAQSWGGGQEWGVPRVGAGVQSGVGAQEWGGGFRVG